MHLLHQSPRRSTCTRANETPCSSGACMKVHHGLSSTMTDVKRSLKNDLQRDGMRSGCGVGFIVSDGFVAEQKGTISTHVSRVADMY